MNTQRNYWFEIFGSANLDSTQYQIWKQRDCIYLKSDVETNMYFPSLKAIALLSPGFIDGESEIILVDTVFSISIEK